jgi:hypothetical protein
LNETGLSDEEIDALAAAFNPGPAANVVLRRAGFPNAAVPASQGLNGVQFWTLISNELENGIIQDGRRKVLAAALRDRPYNDVLKRAVLAGSETSEASAGTTPSPAPVPVPIPVAIRRVLVVGASTVGSPALGAGQGNQGNQGKEPIRADRESKLIREAAELGHLTVDFRPAATVDDLDGVLTVRPDILHLICHGDGRNLTFADTYGEPRHVPAVQVANLLAAYRRHAGVRLAGIVLNACYSADIAELFTPIADTVIAHKGSLDDGCAQLFAARLYRGLRDVPSLGAAALLAAEHLATGDSGCGDLGDGLRVLPVPAPYDGR